MTRTGLMLLFVASLLLGMARIPPSATAQDEASSWRLYVYDEAGGDLLKITPTGIEPALPSAAFDPLRGAFEKRNDLLGKYVTVAITGDYIAALAPSTSGTDDIIVGNLADPDGCCQYVPNPLRTHSELQGPEGYMPPTEIGIGGISPDGSIVAIYFVLDRPIEIEYATYSEIWYVVVETGNVVNVATVSETDNHAPRFYQWDEMGLHYDIICFLCTHGILVYGYRVDYANLRMGEASVYENGFVENGTVLPTTGEVIAAGYDGTYPIQEVDGPIGSLPNVIRYQPAISQDSTTIYVDIERFPEMGNPRWVLDGQAFLLWNDDEAALVSRDGQTQLFARPTSLFLSGTPDGWLAYDWETGIVLHYTGPDTYTELGQVTQKTFLRMVSAAPFNTAQDVPPFSAVE